MSVLRRLSQRFSPQGGPSQDSGGGNALDTAHQINEAGVERYRSGDLEGALAFFREALAMKERVAPGSLDVAASLNNLAATLSAQGELGPALEHYKRALGIYERLAPKSLDAAACLNNIGYIYHRQDYLAAALEHYERGLAIREQLAPNSLEVANSLNNIGGIYQRHGDLASALEHHERAFTIIKRVAAGSLYIATSLHNIGGICAAQGDVAAALDHYQRALAIRQRLAPDSLGVAASLNNIGMICRLQGDLAAALDHYQRALAIRQRLAPDSLEVAESLIAIGEIHHDQESLTAALEHYQRALAIQQRLAPNSLDVSETLVHIAALYRGYGDLAAALDHGQRALAIRQRLAPDSLHVAESLHVVAQIFYDEGDLALALDHYERALAISQCVAPHAVRTAAILNNIGCIHHDQHDLAAALEHYRSALAISQRIASESMHAAATLDNIGQTCRDQGDFAEAVSSWREAVRVIEQARTRAAFGAEGRRSILRQHLGAFERLSALLRSQGNPDAFHYSERCKARELVELLAEREIDPGASVPADMFQRKQTTQRRLGKTYERLAELRLKPSEDETTRRLIAELEASQRQDEEELDHIEREIRRLCPEYAALEYPEPVTLEEAQGLLDGETVLIEYLVGDHFSGVWALTMDRWTSRELEIAHEDLSRAVAGWRAMVGNEYAEAQARVQGIGLFDLLIKPLREFIPEGTKRLVIIPDGPLFYLPFEALATGDDGLHLGDLYTIVYFPSATVWKNIGEAMARKVQRRDVSDLLAFGDPTLPEAEEGDGDETRRRTARRLALLRERGHDLSSLPEAAEEARKLYEMHSGETADPATDVLLAEGRAAAYLHAAATERRAKEECGGYRYVHFAAHGAFNERHGLYSSILLAPSEEEGGSDGQLEAWEVFGLQLNTDLVTLSACDTGLGQLERGEGVIGLTRAFLYAGTPSVVVSLWKVSDASTRLLMEEFHQRLRSGMDKATALREAKKALREKHPEYARPYYWAPFVLVGSWEAAQSSGAPRSGD